MFENINNIKQIGFVKNSTIPIYELEEYSAEEWNAMVCNLNKQITEKNYLQRLNKQNKASIEGRLINA